MRQHVMARGHERGADAHPYRGRGRPPSARSGERISDPGFLELAVVFVFSTTPSAGHACWRLGITSGAQVSQGEGGGR